MVFHAVKAEEKKVPLRLCSEELITVDAGKKRRSSTESGSSSDLASETIASRMKRAKRAAAVTSKGPIDLDPIEEEVDKPKEAGALTAIPEPTVMDLDAILEVDQGKGEASEVLSNTGGQDLLVSLTTSSFKVCGVGFSLVFVTRCDPAHFILVGLLLRLLVLTGQSGS